ncbi:DUF6083 domain-containing protein [Kineococcus terrestris]|uniref:DUF6083 domain-containing protein n=1 Tax=Kineococcus terrestris TaxID=2044856 RepID=UPI0034DB1119
MTSASTAGPAPVCEFCASADDVVVQERLGVRVAVCAACTARFAAARPAPPPVEAPAPVGLPPTLGEQAGTVLAHVRRMARLAAARPWTEEVCARCGALVHRYRSGDGDGRVDLAREPVLAAAVPPAARWEVVDGRAAPAAGDDPDRVGARVPHALVCAEAEAPANARLHQLWAANRRGRDRRDDPSGVPSDDLDPSGA